jgi:TRAP transporter TAXI family solute receptor
MMRPSMRRISVAAAAAVLLAIGAYAASPWGLTRSPANPSGPVIVATGDIDGFNHAYGQALGQQAGDRLGAFRILGTNGPLENLDQLSRGAVTFALATADLIAAYPEPVAPDQPDTGCPPGRPAPLPSDGGVGGVGGAGGAVVDGSQPAPGPGPGSIRAVAKLFDSYVHLVVRADLSVYRPQDLRGRRVSVGEVGSGTALVAERVLAAAGLNPATDTVRLALGLTEAVEALRDGCIDAFFVAEGLGSPAMARLSDVTSVRLVDLGETAAAVRKDHGSFYQVGDIPDRTYPWQPVPVVTIAVPTLLLTTEAISHEIVRAMTELIFDSAPRIAESIPAIGQVDRHSAIFTGAVRLHDGARAYYRATKVGT